MPETIAALVVEDSDAITELRSIVEWSRIGVDPVFVTSLPQAIEQAESFGFDVVITGASSRGLATLESLSDDYPEIARVQLSTGSGGASPHAHHVVSPPVDSAKLLEGLSSAIRLRGGVERTRLGQLIERAQHLPSLPDVYLKLQNEIRSEDPAVARVAELIEQDPALSVKILQLVNSPFMGLRREVGDVQLAATLIGLQRITYLVLACGVFKPSSNLDQRLVEQLWKDSLTVGGLARRIAQEEGLEGHAMEEAQLAGLLHDLGELVLFQNWREEFMQIDPHDRDATEQRIFGATHADISGYLCASWGLPRTVVDAVTYHHFPSRMPSEGGVSVVTAVHVARSLVDAGTDVSRANFDRDHLETVGALERVENWAGLATNAAA